MDWYDNIEPNIRDKVKLLRDNGFNTTCSCEHEMYIEMGYNNGEFDRLYDFLCNNELEPFTITVTCIKYKDGFPFKVMVVDFGNPKL